MNVQGFLSHKDELENVLVKKYKPSIIGFTETHVTQQIEDHELDISGYICVRGDSESYRTGGVLLYVDRRIKFFIIAIETCDKNWWSITVKIKDKNYIGIIMLMYHSPNGSDAGLLNYLEEACIGNMQNDNVIVMGDFNMDMKINKYTQN